jgi:hypothetical protein
MWAGTLSVAEWKAAIWLLKASNWTLDPRAHIGSDLREKILKACPLLNAGGTSFSTQVDSRFLPKQPSAEVTTGFGLQPTQADNDNA